MSDQIIGYYSSRKEKLLKDFDKTCSLMKDPMTAHYGEGFTSILLKEMRKEYKKTNS